MRRFLWTATAVVFSLALSFQSFAEEQKDWKLNPVLKTHTILAATNLSGSGENVPGLAATYNMSLFEFNWGGRQSTFNGSGITTNSNFPLVEGQAISTNTDVGVEMTNVSGLAMGIQGEWYALAGNRTVGRVFGEELPWDNFDRKDGHLVPAHSNLDLDRGWIRYAGGPWSVQLTGGTLPVQTLPEFTRKTMNNLKLGSFVWRPPITNESFFEKEDRKLEEGRHPVRGGDLIADYEYDAKKHLHLELFSGQTKPTPVANIDRLSWGGRMSADVIAGNLGLTFVRANGELPRSERENLWALDSSYPICPWASLYGAFAQSSYTRGSTNLDGTGVVGGLALKGPHKIEGKVQYQWMGENYDLIGTHKSEHYPTNFRGIEADASVPINQILLKGIVYHLRQMETNTKTGDTLFGDSYFPALQNSKPGRITVGRLGAEANPWQKVKLKGYIEGAQFRKEAPAASDDIDKWVTNVSLGVGVNLTEHLSCEAGIRHFIATGHWQTMRFQHRQEIPELSLSYAKGKNLRATLIYHWYSFVDSIDASSGNNNYEGHQLLAEVLWKF